VLKRRIQNQNKIEKTKINGESLHVECWKTLKNNVRFPLGQKLIWTNTMVFFSHFLMNFLYIELAKNDRNFTVNFNKIKIT